MRWIGSRAFLLIVGLAATLVPGSPTQVFGGVPLGPPSILLAALVVYAAIGLARPKRVQWLMAAIGAVTALKLALAPTAPLLGLNATYWSKATPDGAPERSVQRGLALDLKGEQFAVHFFNDAARFNFGPDVSPGRDQLPFSVRWTGWLLVPADGPRRLVLDAEGTARVAIDAQQILGSSTAEGEQTTEASPALSAGLHELQVDYSRPQARVPRLRLSWESRPGAALEAIGAPALRARADARNIAPWRVLGWLADAALALAVLGWLALGGLAAITAGREARLRACLSAVPIAFLALGLLVLAPVAGRASILSGLDDWLVYESSARDILLNGLLMTGGQDHAAPYYGQPLYPYVLALVHLLTGESLYGPLVVQYAALGAVVGATFVLGRRSFGTVAAAVASLVFFVALLELEPEHFKVARQLFNENLYMPLVMASLIAVVGLARRARAPAWWQALLLGVLFGVTAISRSQFLLFVPFGILVSFVAWRCSGAARAIAMLGLILVGVAAAIAPVTWRNWAVSGQLVPISASGGASLLEFHRPPPGLIDQAALARDPLFEALHLDSQTRTVLAFARQDPRGYVATLLPLGAHSIGLQGRNDAGIYWPLFITVLLYVASFALSATRRLHVWPIHAFVLTHLLVLMLFEADTYGYRLVVPMYAPMAVVAAQLPLAAVQRVAIRRLAPAVAVGLGLLAFGQQVRAVATTWTDRDTSFHGLGGLAAHAAQTADAAGADVIYVASIDGTPRRYGAGNLPGLRYPRFKWFDPARSLPLPAPATRAVYALGELDGHDTAGSLTGCLGSPDAASERVLSGADARQQCAASTSTTALGAMFENLATIDAVHLAQQAEAGTAVPVDLIWHPLRAPTEPQQVSVQLDDPQAADGTQWGNGTLELYPSSEWEPDEALLSRLPVATDPTAIPQAYRATLGMGPLKANAQPAMAVWQGQRVDRVPVGSVTLSPGTDTHALPADMQPLEGSGLSGGGLQLIATSPLQPQAAAGARVKLGLLWRAQADGPSATEAELRLVRQSGEVVQRSALPLLGGRFPPTQLKAGNVVRDEQMLTVSARAPTDEQLSVELSLLDSAGAAVSSGSVRIGTLRITGRQHDVEPPPDAAHIEATFGDAIQLLDHTLDPHQVKPGATEKVRLRWRGLVEMDRPYKVFVHVLDPSASQVIAQRDAEPKDGAAPTTSWLIGEVLDDEYAIPLPANVAPGDYPVEVGLYDARSGDRLSLSNGDSRVVLSSRVQVR